MLAAWQDIIDADPGKQVAKKLEDAQKKVQAAIALLVQVHDDPLAQRAEPELDAQADIKAAIADLDAAVKKGLDSSQGAGFENQLDKLMRRLTTEGVWAFWAQGGDPTIIAEAVDFINQGDASRAAQEYKDAATQYRQGLETAAGL